MVTRDHARAIYRTAGPLGVETVRENIRESAGEVRDYWRAVLSEILAIEDRLAQAHADDDAVLERAERDREKMRLP